MELEQAINLISQVAAQYKGTLEEHNALQTALKTINDALEAKKDKK